MQTRLAHPPAVCISCLQICSLWASWKGDELQGKEQQHLNPLGNLCHLHPLFNKQKIQIFYLFCAETQAVFLVPIPTDPLGCSCDSCQGCCSFLLCHFVMDSDLVLGNSSELLAPFSPSSSFYLEFLSTSCQKINVLTDSFSTSTLAVFISFKLWM